MNVGETREEQIHKILILIFFVFCLKMILKLMVKQLYQLMLFFK